MTTEYMTVEPECVFACCNSLYIHVGARTYVIVHVLMTVNVFFCSLMDATRFQYMYYVQSRFACGTSTHSPNSNFKHQISRSLRAFVECRILLSFVSKYCDNNTGLQSVSKDLTYSYLKSIFFA